MRWQVMSAKACSSNNSNSNRIRRLRLGSWVGLWVQLSKIVRKNKTWMRMCDCSNNNLHSFTHSFVAPRLWQQQQQKHTHTHTIVVGKSCNHVNKFSVKCHNLCDSSCFFHSIIFFYTALLFLWFLSRQSGNFRCSTRCNGIKFCLVVAEAGGKCLP